MIAAAIVGIMGGLAAAALKTLTHLVAHYLGSDFHSQYKYYFYFFFPLLGLTLTVLYIKTFIRKKKFNHGIPPLIKSVLHGRSRLDFHNSYSQIISSALTVGFGGSAGLEAPAVASGSSIGSNVGRIFGLNYRETTLLLACGGGAGIAGAFNSPVAGMVFAMEVLLPAVSIPAIIPLLIACAFASVAANLVNSEPLFAPTADTWHIEFFWVYVVFGLLAGFYSVYFSKLNEGVHRYFHGIKNAYKRVLIGGLTLGLLVVLFPSIYGEGYIAIQKLLNGDYHSLLANSLFSEYQTHTWILIGFSVLTLLAKTLGCVVTMGSGGNGGMFGPSVGVGALLGFIFAFTLNQTGWVHLQVTNFMIAGMAASVSGVMHAPLTGVFLSAEITGGYVLLVPLMLVSAISYFINKEVRKYSIYTKPLAAEGDFITEGNKDAKVLRQMHLKYLIEDDFVILWAKDFPTDRQEDIIHSKRVLFPVLDTTKKLLGVLTIEELLEHLLHRDKQEIIAVEHLVQPTDNPAVVTMPMKTVIHMMDQQNTRILPVVDEEGRYLGFVTKNRIFKQYRRLLLKENNTL